MLATNVSHYPKIGDAPGQQKLRQAIARVDRGEADAEELATVADEVTVDALREQGQAGLDLVTDGQIRWQDPLTYICSRLEGFEIGGLLRWFETNTYFRQPHATGPISWTQPILVRDLQFAREHATADVKPVVTGPYTIATLATSRAHASHRDFVLEVARALNSELKALAAESPTWIQVDEPAMAANPSVQYPRDFELFAEAMAVLTEGVEADLSLYIYHGSAHDIPGLLSLPFRLIGLDMVQGADNWSLLDSWNGRKGLGLGLVDARNVRLEDPSRLASEAERAARESSAPEVHLSPSCGLEFLPRETALRKLELVARAAHELEVPA